MEIFASHNNCVEPDAPWAMCCLCGRSVKTCERQEAFDGDYTCPAHPNGVQLSDGRWVCSRQCWDVIAEDSEAIAA